jgi:hypothetical protein
MKNTTKISVALMTIAIALQPNCALAKTWWLKGKTVGGAKAVGYFDNNRGSSCMVIGGKVYSGTMPLDEADPYYTKNPLTHFISDSKIVNKKANPFQWHFYIKVTDGPTYLMKNELFTKKELDSINCETEDDRL